jgi:1,4-alpha-glucan branching enzyme
MAIIPVFFLAFNPAEKDLELKYYLSLKSLKDAEAPKKVRMIRSDGNHNTRLLSEGILFTLKSRQAKSVMIAGNFSGWKTHRMTRSKNGIWYYYLLADNDIYEIKYKFMIDGIWTPDPVNPDRVDDGAGSYVSLTTPMRINEGKQLSYKIIDKGSIEFRIYRPDARFVSIVGDFNHWNPENDILNKGRDGIWRLKKRLPPGVYRYKYIIDGLWSPDIYNSKSGSDISGEICSIIEVK